MGSPDWNKAAGDYEDQVASVYDLDRKKKVLALIERYGWPHRSAVDLGCGPGKFLPALSTRFGAVHACDYSSTMLAAARGRVCDAANVSFEQCDLRRKTPHSLPADFALCVNVLISPGLAGRQRMWANVAGAIKPGGRLALVVPSLESALLARHRLVEWNLRSGTSAAKALTESFDDSDPDAKDIARGGIMDAGGVATKHYLREEIEATAARFRLRLETCAKIEYRWSTEFNNPPRWMRSPYPWDWLAMLTKR
jgi:SAM-dependent methyltransferase